MFSPADLDAWAQEFHTPAPVEEPLVLVWAVDPITKYRHTTLKKKSEVEPEEERVRL